MSKDWVLHEEAFVELRNSPEIVAVLEREAQAIAAKAGEGVVAKPPEFGRGITGRARISVITDTFEAMRKQAYHSTLTQAVGSTSTWKRR